jgi:tetraacyldisaccharide 4'-kinase
VKQSTYRDLISGSRRGALAGAARLGLKAASFFYGAAVGIRNRGFDRGLLPIHRAPAPVVSIGNLTVGGTGKTPLVAAVIDWFASRGMRPAILSRGYRSLDGAANDEELVLDQLCPHVAHLQARDRVRSAAEACRAHAAEVLILDDGFQHRRLARDLDLVLIDALDPWGGGHLLPRGLLREPRAALRRAGLVILTRADQCPPEQKERILAEIRAAWDGRTPVEIVFRPVELINAEGKTAPFDVLRDRLAAFCGIGNPQGFRRTLSAVGVENRLAGFRTFDDHHHYTPADCDDLSGWARNVGASGLLTTQKDLVKIPHADLGGLPLWAVVIRAQITAGQEAFDASLQGLATRRPIPS